MSHTRILRLCRLVPARAFWQAARALVLAGGLALPPWAWATEFDERAAVAAESLRYRAAHPEFPSAPKHDALSLRSRAVERVGRETPGGVGFGYYFNDTALLWTNSSVLDYYIITPSVAGGDLNYYLYLTSTCRAQLGTESLISYYGQQPAAFWVYDWSLTTDRWKVGLQLPGQHPEYLTLRPDEFANFRQMCRVRNGTFYLGFSGGTYHWENRVWLFNFSRGDWDLVYSHSYPTTSLNSNRFTSGADVGFWGPIVEVFLADGTYDNLNPVGFDLARLFQDGVAAGHWLAPANSYSQSSAPFKTLTQAPNTSFVAYTGPMPLEPFRISGLTLDPANNRSLVGFASAFGRDYRLVTGPTPTGLWVSGTPMSGDGSMQQLAFPSNPPSAFFRVQWYYNSGSVCITVNTNAAGFALSPSHGLVAPNWVATPDGQHWDKTVVGLPAGTYTLTFTPVPGRPTPAARTLNVVKNGVAQIAVDY